MIYPLESVIHQRVADHIRAFYPNVLFNSDMAGIRMTVGQSLKMKKLRSHNGFPDIAIYHKTQHSGALFIELKREGTELYKKDGTLINEHIEEQDIMIKRLRARGYSAFICIGLEEAKRTIDNYMKL